MHIHSGLHVLHLWEAMGSQGGIPAEGEGNEAKILMGNGNILGMGRNLCCSNRKVIHNEGRSCKK